MLGKSRAASRILEEGPPFPEPLEYLWGFFTQHSMGLAASGMGYPVITWEGLAAWSEQMHVVLEPWEVDVMMRLSCDRANVYAEKTQAEIAKSKK